MKTKHILGLDIGTNSIGVAVVRIDENGEKSLVEPIVSRIIPMGDDEIGDFNSGTLVSAAAMRRQRRSLRRRIARFQLRRERLLRVLNVLGFLPPHFAETLDFRTRKGKFKQGVGEPKLPWNTSAGTAPQFLFERDFEEMCAEFQAAGTLPAGRSISRDWTLYFLRKKALSKAISREALSWILLSFNAKRGYKAERGDDDIEDDSKNEYFVTTRVVSVEEEDTDANGKKWFKLVFEDKDSSGEPLIKKMPNLSAPEKMVGAEFNLVVTENKKNGKVSLRSVDNDDWKLRKTRNEKLIGNRTAGEFVYESLLKNPESRIVREIATIDRGFYRKEAFDILRKQSEFIPELRSRELFEKCVRELYPHNEAHVNLRLGSKKAGIVEFILNDVLFYQRPLKSKKSEVDVCALETCRFAPRGNGERKTYGLRCAARSNPLFAEFRIRQFIADLRVIDEASVQSDVTETIFPTADDKERLFDWLNGRSSVNQEQFLKDFCKFGKKGGRYGKEDLKSGRVHWNYLEKDYPCNPVRAEILKRFRNCGMVSVETLDLSARLVRGGNTTDETVEHALWHLLYSVVDREELQKALCKFSELRIMRGNVSENLIPEEFRAAFVSEFLKIKRLDALKFVGSGYAAYSERALRKMLALMRGGKRWSADAIDARTRERIDAFLAGTRIFDERILLRAKENGFDFESEKSMEKFSGLPVWLAAYIVYGRHSESSAEALPKWSSPDDITRFLEKEFRRNSLRNPTVERVVLETLRVVRDIWKATGTIDEIHVELGREIRQPAEKRRRMTEKNLENELENLRIRRILEELKASGAAKDVVPGSPAHQDILKIYEAGARADSQDKESDEEKKRFAAINKNVSGVSIGEIHKYRLWLDQKYCSPYTGKMIPLSELFTKKYEIEHVIPRASYYDNSFANKVICESVVNKAKGNRLAMNFIREMNGGSVGDFKIRSPEEYETFVNRVYHGKKRDFLLATEIPTNFSNSQLSQTQYIAKYVRDILSRIVRKTDGDGNATENSVVASNIISCTGTMTDALKRDWGLNDKWNEITLPRFRKMNALTGTNDYTVITREGHEAGTVPTAQMRDFRKKRIDHRHHAMDAIVIACCSREHVQLMSNESAGTETHGKLRLNLTETVTRINERGEKEKSRHFKKPWATFPQDVKAALEKMIPTFRKNVRVMSKGRNVYERIDPETGAKIRAVQVCGDIRKIRKPLHKDTFYGRVNLLRKVEESLKNLLVPDSSAGTPHWFRRVCDKSLRRKLIELYEGGNTAEKTLRAWFKAHGDAFPTVNLSKIPVWKYSDEIAGEERVAARKPVDKSINLENITDESIRKTLENFLASKKKNNGKKAAFSAEDLAEMNREIEKYTPNGKSHKPIWCVRVSEKLGEKFQVGESGNKASKFVEAAKGTNLFFAVYRTSDGKREFETIPLRTVIENVRANKPPVPAKNARGNALLFSLSPGDIVYLPSEEEITEDGRVAIDLVDRARLFKIVSFSGTKELCCVPVCVAKALKYGAETEFGSKEKIKTNQSFRQRCLPVRLDRLGNILKVEI